MDSKKIDALARFGAMVRLKDLDAERAELHAFINASAPVKENKTIEVVAKDAQLTPTGRKPKTAAERAKMSRIMKAAYAKRRQERSLLPLQARGREMLASAKAKNW